MKIITGAVISGGGAFGSCGNGTLAALNRDYDIVAGVSTGSLMAPLIAIREWERLKIAYTSVTGQDIFDYNPFTASGKIHVPKVLWRVLQGKTTLGESNNLRKTIDKFLTYEDILTIRKAGKQVIVACQETSQVPEKIYYFSTKHCLEPDFKDWMWASANAPLAMSILYKNGGEWTDAGLTELLSLKKVVELGSRDIDVIIHRPRPILRDKGKVKDLFHNAARLFDVMRKEGESNDLAEGLWFAKEKRCKVNVYWLPEKLSDNSLVFNKKKMLEWYQLGFNTAFDESRIDRYDFTSKEAYQLTDEVPSQVNTSMNA